MTDDMLITQIPVGSIIEHPEKGEAEVLRFHRGAPKGKVCFEFRSVTGVSMVTVDDLTRFPVKRVGYAA